MTGIFGKRKSEAAVREQWLRTCLIQNELRLIKYSRSIVNDLETAKDIVQESFVRLWEQAYEKVRGHEEPWLFTTCRNLSYDHLRKKERKHISADEIELEIPDLSSSAEESLMARDDSASVKALISSLSASQREILHMKFELNLSYKEISALTGLSVSHVGVLIHNIVTKIKNNLSASNKGGIDEN